MSGSGTLQQESCEGEQLFLKTYVFLKSAKYFQCITKSLKLEKEAPIHINFLQRDWFIETKTRKVCLFAFCFRKVFSLGKQCSTTEIFPSIAEDTWLPKLRREFMMNV